MKDFAEAYKAASAKAREYQGAKRAGWAEPGKRTRENHAILIPRWEAVDMADNLATAIYAKEVYITWAMNLRGFMVQLATGEHDAVTCRECGGMFRAGWMNGKCPYCEAEQAATRYVDGMREAAGKRARRRSACGRKRSWTVSPAAVELPRELNWPRAGWWT